MKPLTQIAIPVVTPLFRSSRMPMKQLQIVAFMLTLGAGFVCAHENSVTMKFSGTSENSATNLQQPNTSTGEDNFAGKGTLGSFTDRNLRATANTQSASSSCSDANHIYFTELAGGGIFRFHDGSLLYMQLTHGGDCIDLATNVANCTVTFRITGGTGRFKDAAGVLTLTETVNTVLSDALSNPVFFAATGEFTGTISGVAEEEEAQEKP